MMTDVWNGCSENDNENSCDSDDQQELESYLYSLVHHDSSVGDNNTQGLVEEISPSGQDNPDGPQKGWRYFNQGSNVTPYPSRNDSFSKRLEELSERYNCNSLRNRGPSMKKIPYWRRPQRTFSNQFEEMDYSRNKPNRHSPNMSSTRSSNIANARSSPVITRSSSTVTNARSSSIINTARSSPNLTSLPNVVTSSNLDLQEISSTPSNQKNDSEVRENISLSSESVSPEIPSCPENQREDESNQSKENSGEQNPILPTEGNDDLNNTNPSLSSLDDCFELPQTSFSKPKSKSAQNLNDCMTQVLGSMLDEDASRSSIESDKRPVQKPSKNGSGSGWTIGMSWEDMSSKFRFNFEVDSVCGDSVREGSISSSRANSPDLSAMVTPEEECSADVSKYNVSLKMKEDASDSMAVNEESDSEVESVVEVTQPQKEPPPVVEISSDTEDVVPAKITKLDDDPVIIEEDIVILYETPKSSLNRGTSTPTITTPAPMAPTTRDPNAGVPSKKRERLRKKAKRQSEERQEELATILAGMSDDPRLWRLCREDCIGKPSPRKFRPCDNCKQRDHNTWRCPEPVKIKVCPLCAQPGHNHYRCPDRMCLSCGAKAPSFVKRCHQCIRNHHICSICKWSGHFARQCPDLWRRYHLTTSTGSPVAPADDVVSPAEAWCCNCAKKGHHSHDCPLPCSPINEKIFSHVVSYANPTRSDNDQLPETPGISNAQTPGISYPLTPKSQLAETPGRSSAITPKGQRAKSPCVSKNAESPRSGVRPDSPASPSGSAPEEGPSQGESASKVRPVDFFDSSMVRKNYTELIAKLKNPLSLPSQPDALAGFLEAKLEQIKKPVLKRGEIKLKCARLKSLLGRLKFRKNAIKKAYTIASQLNMTILGYGKLANAEYHITELKNQIEALRHKTGKVPTGVKRKISDHYQVIFQGCIRNDLMFLVNEYLFKDRRSV